MKKIRVFFINIHTYDLSHYYLQLYDCSICNDCCFTQIKNNTNMTNNAKPGRGGARENAGRKPGGKNSKRNSFSQLGSETQRVKIKESEIFAIKEERFRITLGLLQRPHFCTMSSTDRSLIDEIIKIIDLQDEGQKKDYLKQIENLGNTRKMTDEEGVKLLFDSNLSQNGYQLMRNWSTKCNHDVFPSYKRVLKCKQEENIIPVVTAYSARVPKSDIVSKTLESIYWHVLDEADRAILRSKKFAKFHLKSGWDGRTVFTYR